MVGRVHLLIMNILSMCSKALSIGTKFFVVFFFLVLDWVCATLGFVIYGPVHISLWLCAITNG